jgi:alkylation response protein AidB-like acyl-CoA dehydrogenase
MILDEAVAYLQNEVRPVANDIDGDHSALRRAWEGLAEGGWLALRCPQEHGGPGLGESEFRSFQIEAARASGSLAFLQTQHQSAAAMIAKFAPDELKARLLPLMSHGEAAIGIGFSQLRRPGPPVLRAEEHAEGWILNGEAPWVTGVGIFQRFLIGAYLPDGRALFGLAPLEDQPGLQLSEPMRLAAMESPQTVSIQVDDWLLRREDAAFIQEEGWIRRNDMINVTLQGFFALGCARAGLDVLEAAWARRGAVFIREAVENLGEEWEECCAAMNRQGDPLAERIETRAWGIDLAARCSHAAVAASSGAANSIRHDAQRIYREALVYTVSAQTEDIMRATLARLKARKRPAAATR